jgi:hypothetical protein
MVRLNQIIIVININVFFPLIAGDTFFHACGVGAFFTAVRGGGLQEDDRSIGAALLLHHLPAFALSRREPQSLVYFNGF